MRVHRECVFETDQDACLFVPDADVPSNEVKLCLWLLAGLLLGLLLGLALRQCVEIGNFGWSVSGSQVSGETERPNESLSKSKCEQCVKSERKSSRHHRLACECSLSKDARCKRGGCSFTVTCCVQSKGANVSIREGQKRKYRANSRQPSERWEPQRCSERGPLRDPLERQSNWRQGVQESVHRQFGPINFSPGTRCGQNNRPFQFLDRNYADCRRFSHCNDGPVRFNVTENNRVAPDSMPFNLFNRYNFENHERLGTRKVHNTPNAQCLPHTPHPQQRQQHPATQACTDQLHESLPRQVPNNSPASSTSAVSPDSIEFTSSHSVPSTHSDLDPTPRALLQEISHPRLTNSIDRAHQHLASLRRQTQTSEVSQHITRLPRPVDSTNQLQVNANSERNPSRGSERVDSGFSNVSSRLLIDGDNSNDACQALSHSIEASDSSGSGSQCPTNVSSSDVNMTVYRIEQGGASLQRVATPYRVYGPRPNPNFDPPAGKNEDWI